MPAGYCACCNRAFKSSLLINCSICKKSFRHSCVDLSLEELKLLLDASSKGLDWSCTSCRSFSNELKGLKSLILELQSELRELKDSRKGASSVDQMQFEEIIEEVNQRNIRKCNIVVFGLNEVNQEESPENRTARDGLAVSKSHELTE
nr:unnamed protein product [Callosobruchus analis]